MFSECHRPHQDHLGTRRLTLNEQIAGCARCPLRSRCEAVVCGENGSLYDSRSGIFLVGERADQEDELMQSPFSSRPGMLLFKLMMEAGVAPERCYRTLAVKCATRKASDVKAIHIRTCGTWLIHEIQALKPRVIVTLGAVPTRLLLNLPTKMRMEEVKGTFHSVTFPFLTTTVAPWYGANHILQRGKAVDRETVEFFKKVKHVCEAQVALP